MLVRITHVDHDVVDGKLWVRVAGRSADNKRVVREIEGCEPFFFAPLGVPIPDDPRIVRLEPGYTSFDGHNLVKVITETPEQIDGGRRDAVGLMDEYKQTWEADIPFYRRVAAQYGLSGYVRFKSANFRLHIDEVETDPEEPEEPITPRVCMADIETRVDPDASFDETLNRAHMPVLAITLYDSYTEAYECMVVDPDRKADLVDVKAHLVEHWSQYEDRITETNAKKVTIHRVDREKDLFDCWIDYIVEHRPDVISGWNWVEFDHLYLLRRLDNEYREHLKANALSDVGGVGGFPPERAITGLPGFDMMVGFCQTMSLQRWRSKALDYVSSVELGVGKQKEAQWTDYQNNRALYTAYNIIDVQLTVMLDEKNGIHDFFFQLADLCGVSIVDTNSAMRLVDGYILSRRGPDEVLPTAEEKDIERPAGGLVLDPHNGVEDWVAVLDYKSLYPSVMATCNISQETLRTEWTPDRLQIPAVPENEEDVGNRAIEASDIAWSPADKEDFHPPALPLTTELSDEGLLAKYVRKLFPEREGFKSLRNAEEAGSLSYEVYDRKQAAVKVIMNAFYGVSTSGYFRLAEEGLGDAITSVARYALWKGAEIAKEEGYEVLYGDTDSVFVSLLRHGEDPDRVELETMVERGKELASLLNERMDDVADDLGIPKEGHPHLIGSDLHGTDRHALVVEFEKLYRRWLQHGKKKRYAGLIQWLEGQEVDEISYTGFEAKRSSSPEMTTEVQPAVLDSILRGAGFSEVSRLIRRYTEAIEDQSIPLTQIAIPTAYNPPYGTNLPIVRAVEHANEHLGANLGQGKYMMYYVERTPPMVPKTDVVAREWYEGLPEGYTLDTEEHIRKAISDPLKSIIGMMGWDFSEVRHGQEQQTLGDLYGEEDAW